MGPIDHNQQLYQISQPPPLVFDGFEFDLSVFSQYGPWIWIASLARRGDPHARDFMTAMKVVIHPGRTKDGVEQDTYWPMQLPVHK